MKIHFLVWTLLAPFAAIASEPSGPSTPTRTSTHWSLHSESVREVLRASAAQQSAQRPAPTSASHAALTATDRANEKLRRIDFGAARQTVAYREPDDLVKRMYRAQMRDQTIVTNPDSYDAWLSCQDTNDLMSTFERFDNCRSAKLDLFLDRTSAKDVARPPHPR